MYERLQHAPPARLFHFQRKEHGLPAESRGTRSAVRKSGDMNAKVILNSEAKEREDMVVSDTTLARINELAKKAKTVGLTEEEIAERDRLRQEYLRNFRQKFRSQLEQIQILEPDGSVTPVRSRTANDKKN